MNMGYSCGKTNGPCYLRECFHPLEGGGGSIGFRLCVTVCVRVCVRSYQSAVYGSILKTFFAMCVGRLSNTENQVCRCDLDSVQGQTSFLQISRKPLTLEL